MQTPPSRTQDVGHLDLSRVAQDLQIRKVQVEAVVGLLDEGNTIPFITRYRKERTGGLDEEVLRAIQDRVGQLRQLADRKQTVLKSIENQGKLTEDLRAAVLAADNPKRLEDLYLPFKPKKRSLATAAREKGLEPLALAVWYRDPAVDNLAEVLPTLADPEKQLATPDDVLLGVQHILAETVAEAADVRAVVRMVLWDSGRLMTAKGEKLGEGQGLEYKDYFQFSEPIRHIPPHRILAINRGEKENALQVKLEWDAEAGYRLAQERLPLPLPGDPAPAPVIAHAPAPAIPQPGPPAVPAADTPTAEAHPVPTAASAPDEPSVAEAAPAPEAPPPPPAVPTAEAHPPPPASHGPEGHAAPPAPLHHHPRPSGPVQPTRAALAQLWAARAEALRAHPHAEFLRRVVADALSRLLVPSLEREIRRELTTRAEGHAVSVFARNLRSKLLAPPLRGRRVLAIDPGFRTGCKVAALDETGNLLEDGVIHPHPPQNKKKEAKARLEQLVRRHQLAVVAIGNGTACRETEEVVSELIAELDARRRGEVPPPPAPESAAPAVGPEATPAASVPEVPPAAPTAEAAAPPQAVTPDSVPADPAELVTPAPSAVAASTTEISPPPEAAPPTPIAPVVSTTAVSSEPSTPEEPLPEAPADLAYVIVNEAGASVYSASPVGREEFPHHDATLRGTVSIGRRLQDPLSELVKIDPQHVGVGLYQHDVSPKHLRESLEGVVESCVNAVGVDLNTASVPLLRHVSGLNQLVARDLVEYRKANGPFRSREQLLQVPGIGEARYVQAAGFLKIEGGDNPLDRTWIHPESYPAARQLLGDLGYEPGALGERERVAELRDRLSALSPEEVSRRLQLGVPTVADILDALSRPGRDPREDLPPPVFKKGILKLEDLQAGMELKGTVLNVVDFGAFVDIGLKDSGLVHISQMANRYVKSPYEVAAVGDVVAVWVLSVDKERRRVSLTMIPPGTERKPPERKPQGPQQNRPERAERAEGGERPHGGPPRGARPPQGARPQAAGQGGRRPQQGGRPQSGGRPPHRGPAPAARGPLNRPQTPRGTTTKPPPKGPQPAPAANQPAEAGAITGQPLRKPRRSPPKPSLSQDALAGASPLGTFAELAAFWEAKRQEARPVEPEPQPEPVPPAPPEAEITPPQG